MPQNTLNPAVSSEFPHDVLDAPVTFRVKQLTKENGLVLRSERYDDICIVFVLSGRLNVNIEGTALSLDPNDSVLINANRKYRVYSDSDCQFYFIQANTVLFQNSVALPNHVIDLISPAAAWYILRANMPRAERISSLIHEIAALENQQLLPYRLQISGYLHLLLAVYLDSPYTNLPFHPDQVVPETRNLDQMISYIHRNYQSKIQLDDIAEAGNVSRSRCSPIFRKYLHVTPIEYVNNYRLEVSREYLLDRSISIAGVAVACGFSGQSYYTKQFVRKFGYTPTEYRNQHV